MHSCGETGIGELRGQKKVGVGAKGLMEQKIFGKRGGEAAYSRFKGGRPNTLAERSSVRP